MLKKVALLAGSTVAAQIFTLAISPLLTRTYTPDEFGLLGSILSLSGIVAVGANGRYNLAIGGPLSNRTAAHLFVLSSILCAVVAVLFGLVLVGCSYLGIRSVDSPVFFLGAVVLFAYATSQIDVFAYWQGRNKQFKVTARNSVTRSVLTGVAQLVAPAVVSHGLVVGALVGVFSSVATSGHLGVRSLRGVSITRLRLLAVCRKYKDFPLYSMPQGVLASAGLNCAPLIFGYFFGAATIGQYWLAYRILVAPVALLGGAYRQVALSSLKRSASGLAGQRRASLKHTYALLALAAGTSWILHVFGRDVFTLAFGDRWALAGEIAGWLSFAFMVDLAKIPATTLIHYTGAHKNYLFYELLLVVVRVSVLFLFSANFGFMSAVIAFAISGFVAALCLILWSFNCAKNVP